MKTLLAKKHMHNGNMYYNSGQYLKAYESYSKSLVFEKTCIVLLLKAKLSYLINNYKSCLEQLQCALSLKSKQHGDDNANNLKNIVKLRDAMIKFHLRVKYMV